MHSLVYFSVEFYTFELSALLAKTLEYDDWISGEGPSSSFHAAGTDLPDPHSPLTSLVHPSRGVFQYTSCIGIELLYIGSRWSPNPCSFVWRVPQEYIAYEFVPTSPSVSHISALDIFRNGGRCFVGYCFQKLFNIARGILVYGPTCFFSRCLVWVHVIHPYSSIDTTAAWKKQRSILSVRYDFNMPDRLWLAVHPFPSSVLMPSSVDETF